MGGVKDTICAVVVTYNRKDLLIECLEALRKQTRPVQGIYLIDNASTDGTPELLLEKGYIKELPPENLLEPWEKEFEIKNLTDGQRIKFYYVRMHENTGGAGGFYEGVKRAYGRGYDWLWLMDDDAEPSTNCLEMLLFRAVKNDILAVCPLIYGVRSSQFQFYHHKFLKKRFFLREENVSKIRDLFKRDVVKIDANAFVGPLIHKEVVLKIGFPRKEFFIWFDDKEYTYRISKKFGLYLIPQAIIKHKDAIFVEIKKRDFAVSWRNYYNIRNRIFFEILYNSKFKAIILSLILLIKSFFSALYYKRVFRIYITYRAIIDSLSENMGKSTIFTK